MSFRLSNFTLSGDNWVWYQRVIVTSLAGVLSYAIGSRISGVDPVVASIMAIIALRISIQASLAESFVQLLATGLGAILALGGLKFITSSLAVIAIVIVFAFVASKVFDLGDDGAINISITGLIVSVTGVHTTTAAERFYGTFLGLSIALILSYWAHPKSPLERTVSKTALLGLETASLLDEVRSELKQIPKSDFGALLTKARKLSDQTLEVRTQAEEALRYAKWSPTLSRQDALKGYYKFIALEHIIVQARNLTRGFFDLQESGVKLPLSTKKTISGDIVVIIELIAKKSETLPKHLEFEFSQENLDLIIKKLEISVDQVTNFKDKKTSILLIGIYQALFRIIESLSSNNPAIYQVTTPKISRNPMKNFINSYKKFKK